MSRAMESARLAAAVGLAALALAAHAEPDRVKQGEQVYRRHCQQCHGVDADGQGIHARRFNPPPSNLAASRRSDDYRMQIITLGGAALGRSAVMPEWGLEISGQDILAVVEYLRRVSDEAAVRAKAPAGPASAIVKNDG